MKGPSVLRIIVKVGFSMHFIIFFSGQSSYFHSKSSTFYYAIFANASETHFILIKRNSRKFDILHLKKKGFFFFFLKKIFKQKRKRFKIKHTTCF